MDGAANALEDERHPLEDLTILEAQNGEPRDSEPVVTFAVARGRQKVLGTVGFDDEPLLFAEEVDDERTERLLPAKLRALELTAA